MRRLGLLAAGGLAAVAAASWLVGAAGVRIGRLVPNRAPDPGPPAQPLALAAADGSRIAATFWPGRSETSPAILIVPGLGTMYRRLAANAVWFSELGYAVLGIDVRGHGRSSPAPHGFGWTESADVHAALAWLKTRQRGTAVAVVGISMGGAAALVGPNGPAAADAFVLQAVFADIRRAVRCRIALVLGRPLARLLEPLLSYQSWPRLGVSPARISPLAAVAELRRPVLVIGGARDLFVPPAEARLFLEAARDGRGLWLAPRLGHIAVCDAADEAYRDVVLVFLKETIGAA